MTGEDLTKEPRQDERATPPAIRFDWEDWLPHIAEMEASDDQKRELIETLFAIVIGFVDLGFDLNPTRKICGEEINLSAVLSRSMVECNTPSKSEFNAVGAGAPLKPEDSAADRRSRP